jgi:CRP-like cAMP-binding protein
MAVEVEILSQIPYFSGLSQDELETVRQYVYEKSYERNELIVLEDAPAEALYFVVSGAVKAIKTSVEGKEQILHILRPGDSLNDVPIFDGGPNPAGAVAMSPATLYGIGKTDVDTILHEHPSVRINVIRVLAAVVRHYVSLVEDLSFRHVTGRVARLLLQYADGHRKTDQQLGPGPRLTQQDMAAMVGTAREVVGRSLKELEEEGAIKMDRHRIVIVNRALLEDMSGVSS